MKATIACLTALLTVVSISLAPVCAKGKSHGGPTIKRNADGTVEVTDSGPSGVLPAYGGGGGDDGGYTSIEPDGSRMKRNADGTVEVSDTGPSGVLPGHTSPFPGGAKKPSTGSRTGKKRTSTVRKTAAKAAVAKASIKKAVGAPNAAVRRKLLNRLKV